MYHTKSKHDFMSRYPRSGERDSFQTPYHQTSMAQSSSSTETSPDSFPDLALHQFPPEFRPEEARQFYKRSYNREYETRPQYGNTEAYRTENPYKAQTRPQQAYEHHFGPFDGQTHHEMSYENHPPVSSNFVLTEHIYETPSTRKQRPIMGRNIMAAEPLKSISEFPMWQHDMAQTPPKSVEQKFTQNYELFPSENRGFEFPSPVKSSPHTSPQLGTPPRVPMMPRTSTPVTPTSISPFSPRMSTPFKEPITGPNMSFTSNYSSSKMCMFCRKNGETPLVYMTHAVKEKVGNKNVVTCPILRSHVCSTCGASGDNAHTITYCPVLRSGNNGHPLQSTTITLKNTRVKSNGRRRY